MVFSSLVFLTVFLPVTVILYYLIPSILWKNTVLLIGSLFFYAWGEPKYVFLMMSSILVNYFVGIGIHHVKLGGKKATLLLTVGILFNLGLLVYFKYFNFLADIAIRFFHSTLTMKEIVLPIGISFFTFQSMSYVIDVYRENAEDESSYVVQKNLLSLALYISMFPQLIAGPIVRYHDIQPRLSVREHSFSQFARGIETFVIGLSKKVLIANILGDAATKIMEWNAAAIDVPTAWVGAICYSLQLFYDFSGYSEMAIGLGRMFGFEFQINFDYPYISTSVSEFWRRWHISLSQWFRDYLYIPLGGSRRGNTYFNLFVVFLATGLWHGAAFGFVLWGLWHGFFVILERWAKNRGLHIPAPKPVKWFCTMLVVVLGWTLFKIVGVRSTLGYYAVMFGLSRPDFIPYSLAWYINNRTAAALAAACIFCIPWKSIIQSRCPKAYAILLQEPFVAARRVMSLILLLICILFISNSTYNPFIYFRF